jgi:hypothetical protein
MSENQSFNFLKIAGHGSIIPRPYLPILSSKNREDRTMFCFGFFLFKMANIQYFNCFSVAKNFKIFKIFRIFQILS